MGSVDDDEGMPSQNDDEEIKIDFEDFTIEKEVGKGSFGVVYKATYFGSDVALKQLRYPTDTPEINYDKYIKREVAVQRSMRHPNIVRFVGISFNEGMQWIVTEYVAGGNLNRLLKNKTRELSWRTRIKLAQDIAAAMAYLHSRKILFRDLKTKNVLIDETGNAMRALLCDFGFARAMLKNIDPAANSRKLKALTICGTDDYMAPEVIMGMPYNEKVDVFSYGIVLLELITRKKAEEILLRQPQTGFDFDKEELRAALVATDKEQQRKYPGQDPCPPLFAELFFACCAYNPQDRPGFKDIIVILAKIAKEAGAPPATPPPVAAPIQIHHKPGSKIASNPNPNPNDTTHTSNPNTNTGTSTSNASTLKIVNSNSEILSEQQAKNKFTDLQDAVQLQLDNMAKIVSTLEAQILEITNEKDIMKVKPQCRIIIEMKEYLNGIVNAQSVIIPPVDEPTDSSRFGLFKKTISQSIAQIRTHLQYLKGIVADGSKYAQLVTIAKTVRQIKKTLEELNYANN